MHTPIYGDYCRDSQKAKMQRMSEWGAYPHLTLCNATPTPKAQGKSQKGRRKDCKTRGSIHLWIDSTL